jgi:hypothetical protein
MKHESKLSSQEQEQLAEVKAQQTAMREFASVEEVLRHDAGQTAVPPGIAERLARSVQNVPPPERSWWQRWLKP